MLLEGRVKQRVIDSTGSNIGESVTKQRRVEGVTQFKGKIKRDTQYMVEISGKGVTFGAVGKCEYGKAHISLREQSKQEEQKCLSPIYLKEELEFGTN